MERDDREQISGLSKSNLPIKSKRGGRIRDEGLMDQIEERELHFNVTSAYVKAFGGFHEGKNLQWRSSARRASKADGVFAIVSERHGMLGSSHRLFGFENDQKSFGIHRSRMLISHDIYKHLGNIKFFAIMHSVL